MNEIDKEFLLKLATLCEEYDASFCYTTDDDGIHISVDGGREVFVGFLIDAPSELRDAIGAAPVEVKEIESPSPGVDNSAARANFYFILVGVMVMTLFLLMILRSGR